MNWEFKRYFRQTSPLTMSGPMPATEDLNRLGSQGWELVSVIAAKEYEVFWLKRQLEKKQ